jgi:GMP synthase-like glutamine amidotransferase
VPKALVIQNEAEVPPGIVLEALQHLGWKAEVVLMAEARPIPSPYDYQCLVLLGGTMNVDDTDGFPHLEDLHRVTADAIKRDFPVIGLCLGARMPDICKLFQKGGRILA